MANLLINTTVGGNAVITTSNIGTYALTSLPSHNHDDRYFTETESDGRFQPLENQRLSTGNSPSFVSVSANDVYTTGGWFRNHTNNSGIYWSSTGWHLMPENSSDFRFHSGNSTEAAIRMESNGTTRGYVYVNSSNEIGFLNNDRNWRLRVYSGGAVESYNDFRAPIFYDSANTGYYGDFASTSNLYKLQLGGGSEILGLLGMGSSYWYGMGITNAYTAVYSHFQGNGVQLGYYNGTTFTPRLTVGNDGNVEAVTSFKAPIFYDSADNGYYVDPNGLSVLSHIRLNNNWANAGINQGAINIRGQYPSMQFRNTVSDSMWLRHMDSSGTIQHYYASDGVDSSNWNIKHSMYGNGNFSSIGTHTASQFNGSGAGLTGTASSLSVSYATTAGALSSMNISQFTNNSGYITGYTETDTLASVTGRGASTTAAITISREAFSYGGTTQSFLVDGAGGNAALTINAASNYAYLNFAQAGTTKFEIGAEGAATNKGSLYFNHNIQVGSSGAALYIKKSNGYVGILNINPSVALDVTGTTNATRYTLSGTGAFMEGYGTYSSKLGRVAMISLDWNANYDQPFNHGIMSTDSAGNFADSLSINSFNDITLRLDSNNNNAESYLRIMNNTEGTSTIAHIGYNGANGTASFSRDLFVNGGTGGNFGNRIAVGSDSTPYTLQDTNIRPTVYVTGAYPVVALNHTVTGNTSHGPTIQFTFNGLSQRQWVIGCGGSGEFMDFGFSNSTYGNADYNPHNGIAGYSGNTIMRIIDNAVGIGGDFGAHGSGGNPAYTLDVRGTIYSNTDMRAPIFYDSANTGYYGDFASTSVMNSILFGTSTNGGTLSGNSDWGMRLTTSNGWIQFGPANSSYAHIYTDRDTFYFNRDLLVNGNTVITSATIGSQSVSNSSSSNYINSTRDTPGSALQYWQAPSLGITEAPSADWHNTIRMGHGSPLSYYSNTLAVRMTGSGVGDIYTQTIMGGTAQGWKKHWNDGNDGVGSGLDADLLDGQQGSYYQAASSAITTSNIGSQSVSYATTAGALSSMNISQFTNNSGYLTGITSGQVTGALGYTPYNSSNPSGYITSSSLSSYLPLAGGSMTGNINMSTDVGIQYSSTHWIRPRDSSGNLHIKADSGGIYLDADVIHLRGLGGVNDTTVSGGHITTAGGYYTNAGLSTNGSNGALTVQSPGGASRGNASSSETGAFKIKLPAGLPVYGMFKLVIHIYEYGNRGNGYEIHCGGHLYPNYMHNRFQVQYGASNSPLTVRYGNDGSTGCIWIGNLDTTWSYPQIWVSEFMIGYSNTSWATWRSGWSITLDSASFGNSGAMDGPYTCEFGYAATANYAATSGSATTAGSASTAGYSDEAKWISYPDGPRDLSDRLPNWNNRSVAWDFVGAGTANGSGNYGGVMTFSPWDGTSASTGDSSYQLAFANATGVNASGQPKLSIRNGINSTWNAWYTLVHSGNVGDQSVSFATTAGALSSMNISQFTNNSGYITGISFASVSSKPTTVAGYGITDAITTANIGSQSVSYAATAGSAPNAGNVNNYYDATAGNGYGFRFWSGDSAYKISMGVGALYQYGPVTDYSIKMQMNNGDTARGFTWGRESHAPIAALNSTSGDMEVAGYYKSYGYRGNGNVGGTGSASWHPDGIYCAGTMWQYASLNKNNTGIYNVSEMTMYSGPTLSTYNTRNLIVKALDNNADVGILGQKSGGGFAFQIYGTGSSYGFLNGTWAAWDIRKAVSGAMYMNDNDSYYLQTNGTSNFYALNIQGNAVVHAGNIGSQSVSYATTAGSVAWTNVSSRPTALSQFTNDLGNYGGWITGINSGNVTTALGFTPYNATNPAGYTTNTGTVTSITAGTGLSGGTITTSGTIDLANTTVTAGSYTLASITVDAQGRITAASSGSAGGTGTVTSVSGTGTVSGLTLSGTVTSSGSLTLGGTLSLTSGNVTTALGFTPYNATNPSGYISSYSETDTLATVTGRGATFSSNITSSNGAWIKFSSAAETDSNDGKIGSGVFASGLNIVGAQTSAGLGRQIRLWGSVITSAGDTFYHSGNIPTWNQNTTGSAATATSATSATQLSTYGTITSDNWNTYFVSGQLIASSVNAHSGSNRPTNHYDYGAALSYGVSGGALWQMYFPENSGNSAGSNRNMAYRTGWNGTWGDWRSPVNQIGQVATVAGSNGTGVEIHSNVGYNQDPLTYFLMRGQADSSWKALKIRLTGDAGGQDIEFRRIAENSADARIFYVPRGANQVIFDYTVVQPSDSRLKDNLTPITNPVDKIKSLRGVEFDWNSGEHVGTHDVGLIAQDVEAVLPEAVTTQEDGYKNLAYTKVIPLLVEAMKEQQTMIEALRAEIELLKNK